MINVSFNMTPMKINKPGDLFLFDSSLGLKVSQSTLCLWKKKLVHFPLNRVIFPAYVFFQAEITNGNFGRPEAGVFSNCDVCISVFREYFDLSVKEIGLREEEVLILGACR